MPAIQWTPGPLVWVEQWPLPTHKVRALENLVEDQLRLVHMRSSNFPWTSPVFVIKKASGAWRMLQDLRKVNAQMILVGTPPMQASLGASHSCGAAIPVGLHLKVVDLKDRFFSLPPPP